MHETDRHVRTRLKPLKRVKNMYTMVKEVPKNLDRWPSSTAQIQMTGNSTWHRPISSYGSVSTIKFCEICWAASVIITHGMFSILSPSQYFWCIPSYFETWAIVFFSSSSRVQWWINEQIVEYLSMVSGLEVGSLTQFPCLVKLTPI